MLVSVPNHTKISIRISYSATSRCPNKWFAIDLKGFYALSLILPLFGPTLKGVLGAFTVFTSLGAPRNGITKLSIACLLRVTWYLPINRNVSVLASNAATLIILYPALQLGLTAAFRPPKVVPLLVESPPARNDYLITCDYLLVMRVSVYNGKRENAIWHVYSRVCCTGAFALHALRTKYAISWLHVMITSS